MVETPRRGVSTIRSHPQECNVPYFNSWSFFFDTHFYKVKQIERLCQEFSLPHPAFPYERQPPLSRLRSRHSANVRDHCDSLLKNTSKTVENLAKILV